MVADIYKYNLFTFLHFHMCMCVYNLVPQLVKNLPANAGDSGLTPGSGDALEKGMATHSSILAWRIPWTEEPGGLQSMRSQRVGHKVMTNTHTHI